MSSDEKHRGPEYVPAGPVRIRSTSVVANPLQSLIERIERLESPRLTRSENGPINLDHMVDRIVVLEAQVASLQSSAPRGIPKP